MQQVQFEFSNLLLFQSESSLWELNKLIINESVNKAGVSLKQLMLVLVVCGPPSKL